MLLNALHWMFIVFGAWIVAGFVVDNGLALFYANRASLPSSDNKHKPRCPDDGI